MLSAQCRTLIVGCLASGCLVAGWGCAAPAGERKPRPHTDDSQDGWLFNKLTGREPDSTDRSVSGKPASEKPADNSVPLPGATATTVAPPAALPKDSIDARYPSPDPRWEKPKEEKSGWGIFSTKAISDSYDKLTGTYPNHDIARQTFGEAETLFRQAKYADAMAKYQAAGKKWRDSPLEEDALFYAGECEYQQQRLSSASDLYGALLKKYPNSRHLDKVVPRLFAIAQHWEKEREAHSYYAYTPNMTDQSRPWIDPRGYAISTWDQIRLKDPTGPLADDALMAEANVYFIMGRYEDADYYYTLIRKDYPKSEHQVAAHLLGLQAKLSKYQGPDYDGAPLKEADELIDQMLKQFPHELGQERDRIVKAKTQVRGQMADRLWQRAEYYAKSDHFGAAKIYYNQIVKDYPQSNYAQLASERIGEIKGKPDIPEDRMAFLTQWFGNKNDPNSSTARTNSGTVQR